MASNLSLKVFFEMQETAQLAIVDNIQNNVLQYMKGRKTKTWAEREVGVEMRIAIGIVHHATSLRTFRNKFESLKHKGEI